MANTLKVNSVMIALSTGMIECRCSTRAQSYFGSFMVDQPILLNETEDLGGNPAWTNDDLKLAIARKTQLDINDIIF